MSGLYIHIPFCESRCIYCGFYSTTSLKLRETYVDTICHEMKLRPLSEALGCQDRIATIYLGGGTPSLLSKQQLIRLFDGIKTYLSEEGRTKSEEFSSSCPTDIFEGMEITMECNPDDVTEEFCETLQSLPVNRISMGAQTFSDDRLHFLRRRHHAAEVKTAVDRLRHAGISNISIDLMFGFPGETLEDWKSDIQQAIDLQVEHISAYSLMYEEGTALHRLLEQDKVQEIDEELSLAMYDTLCDTLTSAGYDHYEISNFARPGYRSRHNSSYWHEIPYIGLGAAAHSYKRKQTEDGEWEVVRSWNVDNLSAYINSLAKGVLPSESETLDLPTRYNDLITTALRTSDGINLDKMRSEFGEQLHARLLHEAKGKIERGLMQIKYMPTKDSENEMNKNTEKYLALTQKGIYISDDIMGDFMIVE